MKTSTRVLAALALAGSAIGIAQARDRVDVQWQVAIPGPVSIVIGSPGPRVLVPAPVVVAQPYPVYGPVPVYGLPGYGWGDRDRDGIPNRYDRRDDRRGDRYAGRYDEHRRGEGRWRDDDRDGIPNRHDRIYNPPWDRDGDGIPNRYDRHPYRPGR